MEPEEISVFPTGTPNDAYAIAEILTHGAFNGGCPKAWVAFHMAKEIWQ